MAAFEAAGVSSAGWLVALSRPGEHRGHDDSRDDRQTHQHRGDGAAAPPLRIRQRRQGPGYDVAGYDVPGYDVPGYDVPGYDVPG